MLMLRDAPSALLSMRKKERMAPKSGHRFSDQAMRKCNKERAA